MEALKFIWAIQNISHFNIATYTSRNATVHHDCNLSEHSPALCIPLPANVEVKAGFQQHADLTKKFFLSSERCFVFFEQIDSLLVWYKKHYNLVEHCIGLHVANNVAPCSKLLSQCTECEPEKQEKKLIWSEILQNTCSVSLDQWSCHETAFCGFSFAASLSIFRLIIALSDAELT